MLMPLRKPTSADWAQVIESFNPIWAVTLTYNDDARRNIHGLRYDLALWAQRMHHRIHRRSHDAKPRLRFIGWAEKVKTAPHLHLAVQPPAGHCDLARINRFMTREWRRPCQFRGACVRWIDDAGGWGSYISKEVNLLSLDADHLICS